MRFHKSLVRKYRARFTVVLQYSLSEQVRNEREPFTTAGHAMWLICKSTLQVLCYKRKKKIAGRKKKKKRYKAIIIESS